MKVSKCQIKLLIYQFCQKINKVNLGDSPLFMIRFSVTNVSTFIVFYIKKRDHFSMKSLFENSNLLHPVPPSKITLASYPFRCRLNGYREFPLIQNASLKSEFNSDSGSHRYPSRFNRRNILLIT